MRDLSEFLGGVTALRGLSGDEIDAARAVAEAFTPLCQSVKIDAMASVVARMRGTKGEGPRVLITAHHDEIGLMATFIEDDGAIRFTRVGGVDPRILPGSRVTVYTSEGPMVGVVGALPPHLLSREDRKKNYEMGKLHVDLGLPAPRVRALVHPGTQIALCGALQTLENKRLAGKSIDDRGGVAVMLRAAEMLQNRAFCGEIVFVSASQEEVGGIGAETSAYAINPDIAIAIDVTHAHMPGCEPHETHPLDKVVMTRGPLVHPALHKRLMDTAQRIRVDAEASICSSYTGTDADSLQTARAGIPTALIELPLKYMHTTVELLSQEVLEESARLLVAFIEELDAGWEEWLCS